MESNLIQLNRIFQCLQKIIPQDPSSHASSTRGHSSQDESLCNTPFVNVSAIMSKLKADMEYVLKELEQIRRDIKDVRAEVKMDGGASWDPPKLIRRLQIESQNSLNSRNIKLLTFLAAIYVPLTFVSVRSVTITSVYIYTAKSRSVTAWHEYHRVLQATLDEFRHNKYKFRYTNPNKLEL